MRFHIKSSSCHYYACTMPIYNYCYTVMFCTIRFTRFATQTFNVKFFTLQVMRKCICVISVCNLWLCLGVG